MSATKHGITCVTIGKKSYSLKSFVLVGGAKRNIFINKCVYIKVAVNRQQHLGKANGKQIQWTLCVCAGFFLLYFVSLSCRWFMIADQSMCFFPFGFQTIGNIGTWCQKNCIKGEIKRFIYNRLTRVQCKSNGFYVSGQRIPSISHSCVTIWQTAKSLHVHNIDR